MELVCRSFRVERGPSIKFGRSNSSLLISESISSECTRIARYENLSASMRMSNDQDIGYGSRKSRAYTFISKVFSFRKISSDCETRQQADMVTQEKKKGKKKRSSWLPDPERRWPVQDCLNPLIMSTGSLKVLAYELPDVMNTSVAKRQHLMKGSNVSDKNHDFDKHANITRKCFF
ncbi:hypothetical protein POTOM_027993 [Populus tomentosa]|uniref:Uncharacterized protein n=1 Tax=Populus tomentosa TaxID=118781 RepID=A0A8X8CVE0_POPTO|nr:hypothetical protein POTOM_027993 [Populus tomentosa]